jgi:protein gp37
MAQTTSIAWTNNTFNPWWGCTKVTPGCDNCYAKEVDTKWGGGETHWGKGAPRRTFGQAHWDEPLKWNRQAEKAGVRTRVFCASMADVMDDEAPEGELQRLWALIDATPWLDWQLLTKRPQRFARRLPKAGFRHKNVWLGTTCESQEYYDIRWPVLSKVAEAYGLISFISYEPALGPLSIAGHATKPSWLIFGGETGAVRRPMDTSWAENVRDECERYNVSFFMKQMSARTPKTAKDLIPAALLIATWPKDRVSPELSTKPKKVPSKAKLARLTKRTNQLLTKAKAAHRKAA